MQAFELNREAPSCESCCLSTSTIDPIAGHPSADCPAPLEFFAVDWHPRYGNRLCVFPRSLPADGYDRQGYWPDLATLLEDQHTRQIAYFPTGESEYCVRVVYEKGEGVDENRGGYCILIYRDATLVSRGEAGDLGEALAQTKAAA